MMHIKGSYSKNTGFKYHKFDNLNTSYYEDELKNVVLFNGYLITSENYNNVARYILKKYKVKGIEFIQSLNGSFAIVIYDSLLNNVFLIKDRLGSRPLYYSNTQGNIFLFSNNPKELNKNQGISLNSYIEFIWRQAIIPPDTIFNNVYSVEPSSYYSFKENKTVRYWKPSYYPKINNINKFFLELDSRLKKVLINSNLTSPLFATSSGGIDSTIVLSSLEDANLDYTPVCYQFDWSDNLTEYNEVRYSKLVCDYYKRKLKIIKTNKNDIEQGIKEFIINNITPNPLGLGLLYLLRDKSFNNSTVISGLGADELFFGYPEISYSLIGKDFMDAIFQYIKITSPFSEKTVKILADKLSINFDMIEEYVINKMYNSIKNIDIKDGFELSRLLLIFHFLINCDLPSFYNHSTPYGVSTYYPFLANDIIDLAFSTKVSFNYSRKKISKPLLRYYLNRKGLPREIYARRKHGFSVPYKTLLNFFSKKEIKPFNLLKYRDININEQLAIYQEWILYLYSEWYINLNN